MIQSKPLSLSALHASHHACYGRVLVTAGLMIFSAEAVHANVGLYGLIDACYGKSLYSSMSGKGADLHSGGDNGSSECNSTTRVGIKAASDVGNGFKVNLRIETGGITSEGRVSYDAISNSEGPFFNRQAWVGLSGSFGELRVGRQDSVPFQVMTAFDLNGASNGVSAGGYTGVAAWAKGRQTRSIQYITPTAAGVVAHFGVRPKGNGQDGDKTVLSAAVKYTDGPLTVAAALQGASSSTGKSFSSIGGSYNLGLAKVTASYADGGSAAAGGQGKGIVLGVSAPISRFNVGAHWARNNDQAARSTAVEVFANTQVFKNTYGYMEAGQLKMGSRDYKGYSVGVIYVF